MRAVNHRQDAPLGLWLLLLCGLLLVWQPLSVGVTASNVLSSLPLGGLPLAIILAARVGATALGVAAGLAVIGRRPGAIRLTQASLLTTLLVDLLVYATPFFPNNRGPGETPLWVAGSIIYCGGWLLYLNCARRVTEVFGSATHRGDGDAPE
jgi:hypothetical protein